ncbi:MAG: hypothetical protein ACRYGF_15525 [Janthinobacterium lividum]
MQTRTLQIFTALSALRQSWAGTLLLGVGLDEAGRALALAIIALGGAGLFLESDTALLRTAQRTGSCTFCVSTLEEAIRALKNEVRQRRAITIALGGDTVAWLQETVQRGLQPQAFAFARPWNDVESATCKVLESRGACPLKGLGLSVPASGYDLDASLSRTLTSGWSIALDQAGSMSHRRERDRLLLEHAEASIEEDARATVSARWLRAAPSLFPRALDRACLVDKAKS